MEPTAILGAVGFAIAQLSFLVLTAAELNKRRQKFMTCRAQLDDHKLRLLGLVSQYKTWQAAWSRADITPGHYRAIWSEHYDNILRARQRILDLTQELDQTIRKVYLGEHAPEPGQDGLVPQDQLTDKTLKPLRRVAFALSTDTRLSETIKRLRESIEAITELSESALARRIGNTQPTTVTVEETERLVRLISFFTPFTDRAEAIHKAHLTGQILQQTNSWELELGKLGEVTNIKEWDQWDPVEIRFAFRMYPPHPHGTRMSLWVLHRRDADDSLERVATPKVDWQNVVCGNGAPRADVGREPSAVRQCRPFGRLFRDGFFEEVAALKSWGPHRAELILSLVNWVLLLWGTEWTSNLCSFGLRSVCTAASHIQHSPLEVDLTTLSADGSHHGDCKHHHDKLRNFGILLAELITTTTIRPIDQPHTATPIGYQRWSRDDDDWLPMSSRQIITMVHEKSNYSNGMRDVVQYCLEGSSRRASSSFEAGHLLEYIVRIYEPIKKWCKDEYEEAVNFELDMWPRAALEPDPAQRSNRAATSEPDPAQSSQTWLEFTYQEVLCRKISLNLPAAVIIVVVAILLAWHRERTQGTAVALCSV